MTEYTPTTDEVRDLFAHGRYATNDKSPRHRSDALFDRWLTAHDEEVLNNHVMRWLDAHDREVLEKAVERVEAAWDAPMSRDAYDYADWRSISIAAIRGEA